MENRCPPKTSRKSIMSARTIRYGTGPTTTVYPPAPIETGTPLCGFLENNGYIETVRQKRAANSYAGMSCVPKGKNVCDKRHHKDKTWSVNDLQVRIRKRTEDDPTVILWLRNLEREKPRYYRDNMKLLLHVISEYGKETVIAALRTCLEKNIYNSLSVQEISGSIHRSKDNMDGMTIQAPTSIPETADCHPEKTDINQYNKFFE